MSYETIDHRERIALDPSVAVGKPLVKGTRVPVEDVLARLAQNPDLAELLRAYPELTRDDVRAVLSYAHEKVAGAPAFVSPMRFYREMTRRDDVRRILDALAK